MLVSFTTQASDQNLCIIGGRDASALVTYQGHSNYIWSVDWSPDGTNIVSCSSDGTAQVWNASTGQKLLSTRSHIDPAQNDDWAKVVRWSPNSKQILTGFQDGTRLASGSSDGSAQVWRFSDGHTLLKYDAHGSDVRSVSWSPDDSAIVSGGWDGTAKIWDSITGTTHLTYTKHTGGMVNGE